MIHFKAEVNENAVEGEPIGNSATFDFTNKSGTDGHKETNTTEVTPYEGSVVIHKIDKSTNEPLGGAKFKITGPNGYEATGTTTQDGTLTFDGLDAGSYTLEEVRAPEGYHLLRKTWEFTINHNKQDISYKIANTETNIDIPTTGGIGTTLFTIIGLLFMGTAVFFYIRRRRSQA